MSDTTEGLRQLYRRLASTGLVHFVGGSFASSFYGEPRSTMDFDLVVQAGVADAPRIAAAYPAPDFYVPPARVLREELARPRDGHFNVLDLRGGVKADIFVAGDDPLIAYGFAHARDEVLAGLNARVAPPTYVVAMKLRYYAIGSQDKHLRDIRSMLALCPAEIDLAEVERWAGRFGVVDAWRSARAHPGEER